MEFLYLGTVSGGFPSPAQRQTVRPSEGETVEEAGSEEERRSDGRKDFPEKVSFYLTTAQSEKLDDLAHAYRKKYKRRINRNIIIRHMINKCDLDALADLGKGE